MFQVLTTITFDEEFASLRQQKAMMARVKAIDKTLKLLSNPRHPSLQTHEFTSLKGPHGEKIFEAYAQQNTPAAYRVFWHYGPGRSELTVIAFTAHP
ncbi:MAG: hypothetical protein V2A70_01390 [Candidatus Omnitrophota bacterium]